MKLCPSAVSTTAPTHGFGEVEARTPAAALIASAMRPSSRCTSLLSIERAPRGPRLALIRTHGPSAWLAQRSNTVGSGVPPDRPHLDAAEEGFAGSHRRFGLTPFPARGWCGKCRTHPHESNNWRRPGD